MRLNPKKAGLLESTRELARQVANGIKAEGLDISDSGVGVDRGGSTACGASRSVATTKATGGYNGASRDGSFRSFGESSVAEGSEERIKSLLEHVCQFVAQESGGGTVPAFSRQMKFAKMFPQESYAGQQALLLIRRMELVGETCNVDKREGAATLSSY